jgi:hypothetical protein
MPRPFATREDEWRAYLMGTHPRVRSGRRLFALLPFGPRCRQCNVPFRGPGGFVLRHVGSASGRGTRTRTSAVGALAT